jgi:hypothetical protein
MYHRRSSYLPANIQADVYPVMASRSYSYARTNRYGSTRQSTVQPQISAPSARVMQQAQANQPAMNAPRNAVLSVG